MDGAKRRSLAGNSRLVWVQFSEVFHLAAQQITGQGNGLLSKYIRYFNGLVLLARNCAASNKGGEFGFETCASDAMKTCATLFSRRVLGDYESKLQLSLLQFLTNMTLGLCMDDNMQIDSSPFELLIKLLDESGAQ